MIEGEEEKAADLIDEAAFRIGIAETTAQTTAGHKESGLRENPETRSTVVVGSRGLEPPTPCMSSMYSNQLS